MRFTETKLKGVYVVEIDKKEDARGFFARAWCAKEFAAHHLMSCLAQTNISFNEEKGTLRGMHYQVGPHAESKLVRCTRGAIYDVAIDLRPNSPTYKAWMGTKLTADNHKMLYLPEGFAHGFETLVEKSEVTYHVSQFYAPEAERGLRYDDPMFGITWPQPVRVISDKDKNWRSYSA